MRVIYAHSGTALNSKFIAKTTCCNRRSMSTSSLSLFAMFLIAASLVPKSISFSFAIKRARMTSNSYAWDTKSRSLSMMSNDISKPETERLITQANAWCALNGLLYSAGDMKYTMAPVALIPNSFSKSAFDYAQNVQPILNELVDVISRDKDFLFEHLQSVGESDKFVGRLLEIYGSLPDEIIKDSVHLGLHRSDYMINVDKNGDETPLQVEINTIASSFGCLSKKVGDFHRFMLQRNADSKAYQQLLMQTSGESSLQDLVQVSKMIPENSSIKMLAFGLAMAHFVYGDNKACILFIVQPGEKNIADQRLLESELWTSHGARVEFMTLAQVAKYSRLGKGNCLFVRPCCSEAVQGPEQGQGQEEEEGGGEGLEREMEREGEVLVSVAYYRAGYTPDDYPSELEWGARVLIENSLATKCPTVGYQLVGTKKIQQVLCEGGALEKFVSEAESKMLRKCFAAQYSLGPPSFGADAVSVAATLAAVEDATQDGSKWVLKPQREGGGNNLYGSDLSAFLVKHKDDPVLSGYVLMQRIFPKPQTTAFLRKGELLTLPSISELGVYGVFLGDGSSKPLLNSCAGYLLRTKPDGVDEGGVAAGFSVLSSVILTGEGEEDAEQDDTPVVENK